MVLTDSQQEMVTTFQEITQLNDNELCANILQQNGWSLQSAIDNYVSGNTNHSHSNSSSSNANNNSSSTDADQQLASQNTNQEPSAAQSWIVSIIWNPVKWMFHVRPSSINPEQDTRLFVSSFNEEYGFRHPTFQMTSYQNAVQQAFRNHKYLLMYIHSPLHEDTQLFCRNTLCTENVTRYVDENMIFWSGCIWDTEAYSLSIQLKATTYPFVALLVCQSERVVQVVSRIEKVDDEQNFLESLTSHVAQASGVINRIRTETVRRQETASLREEQDREYKEAEEADRKEREKKIKEKEEKERKEHEEAQALELQQAVELSNRLTYEAMVQRKKESLKSEPIDGPNTATIRFQLPSSLPSKNSKITRRFNRTDTISDVSDYLVIYFYDLGANVKNFSLSTHFPKQELNDMTVTVESVGLHPRGMLYVTDLDA